MTSRRRRRVLRPEQPETRGLLHAASLARRIVAEAPEKIHAQRPPNRAAGILSEDETIQRSGRQRPGGGEKYRRAERDGTRIDGDRASRRKRNAERSERTIDGRGRVGCDFAKEHVARILVEQFRQRLRMLPPPFLDRLHRGSI